MYLLIVLFLCVRIIVVRAFYIWPLPGLCKALQLKGQWDDVRRYTVWVWLSIQPHPVVALQTACLYYDLYCCSVIHCCKLSLFQPLCAQMWCLVFHWAEAWYSEAQNRFILIRDEQLEKGHRGKVGLAEHSLKTGEEWSETRKLRPKTDVYNLDVFFYIGHL